MDATMSRVYSVEDIVSNLTKAGSVSNNFPRTDSEQAFQDFLKRIPSSNSLAAFGQSGSQADLAAQASQIYNLQAHVASQAAAAANTSNPLDASAINGGTGILGGGVPRVASLDFFRQLLPVNQLNVAGAKPGATGTAGTTAAAAEGGEGQDAPGAMRRNGKVEPSAGSAFSPPPPSFSELPPIQGVSTGNLTANLSSGNLLRTSSVENVRPQPARAPSPAAGSGGGGGGRVLPPMPTAAPQTEREKELAAKAELRRARRMLSNRESARRSRKRKQEHLGELQGQISALVEQKEELEDELESAQAALKRKDTEISQLRAQNEHLRSELQGEYKPQSKAVASPRATDSQKPPLAGVSGKRSAKRSARAHAPQHDLSDG
mmetsp:Transcript_8219/g.24497  ORF Transcript_8219/g.24497 Transcript_8219/m.24497 type:complete len:377 (-) Transcript_8219:2392-3522(-)